MKKPRKNNGNSNNNFPGQNIAAGTSVGVAQIFLINSPNDYLSTPSVTISGNGSASAHANMSNPNPITGDMSVQSITVDSMGSGYTSIPSVTIGSDGSGNSATAYATLTIAGDVTFNTANFTVKPYEPPTVSCSVNPTELKPGDSATVTATGVSPQNRPLTYSFTSSAGSISGTGNTATLTTTGAPAGLITWSTGML